MRKPKGYIEPVQKIYDKLKAEYPKRVDQSVVLDCEPCDVPQKLTALQNKLLWIEKFLKLIGKGIEIVDL
jgi:uncharacterized protein YeeX (DUF496 family)